MSSHDAVCAQVWDGVPLRETEAGAGRVAVSRMVGVWVRLLKEDRVLVVVTLHVGAVAVWECVLCVEVLLREGVRVRTGVWLAVAVRDGEKVTKGDG